MADKYTALDVEFLREGVAVANVRSIPPFGSSKDLIDASVYGDGWKDWRTGQRDGVEMEVVLAFDPDDATQALFEADDADGLPHDYGVRHEESGLDKTIPAVVKGITFSPPIDGLIEMHLTLKIVNPGVSDNES